MEAMITCASLTKRFGAVVALDHLDLTIQAGTIFGVLGPNGAGKTTLLRLLTGLARPTAGRATVAGLDVLTQADAIHRHIGFLDQQPKYYSWMTGRELLEFTGSLYGLGGTQLRAQVSAMLELTGLTDAARRRIGGYSGGMRQRLGLAQALINDPQVLFLDEPVSALDPEGRHNILNRIEARRGKTTVVMSTHILADVERVCDAVAIIDHGRLVISASLETLQERYAQPIYTIEAEPDQGITLASLANTLQVAPWVQRVERDGDHLRVAVRDVAAASGAILPLLAQSGVRVQRFERGRPSLEDIFLQLVGNGHAQREVA